jgi:hypothetical protein
MEEFLAAAHRTAPTIEDIKTTLNQDIDPILAYLQK